MPFREKTAWISFVSLLAVFAAYFTAAGLAMAGRLPHSQPFLWFIALVVAFVVLQVALRLVVARRAPLDAGVPADEREQLIGLKADRVCAYTLSAGVFAAVFTLHLGAERGDLAHAVLLAFAVSQLAKYAVVIALYRRDA